MDSFEIKEMKNIRPVKNTWYHWLIKWRMGEKRN